ncbi:MULTISPECIES: ABC transporter permease [unclassified Streptomyces]|uniref:ABC transporter permease n=1 Tax=unclassified Streptomyces TaxID=2593676 RepID=UPI0037FF2F69
MGSYFRAQWWLLLRSPRLLGPLVVTPLYSLVFFSVLREHHKAGLATTVATTAFLMSMWSQAVFVASDAVDYDRWEGTLEAGLVNPRRYADALAVRVLTTTAVSLPAFGEILLIGRLGFGYPITVAHPVLTCLVLLLVLCGSAGIALTISGLLVVVRGARTLQNAMTYPFYLLAGLVLPVAALPTALQWPARAFYLSWGATSLRAAIGETGFDLTALGVLALLAPLQAVAGYLILRRILNRAREGKVILHG